MNVFGVGLGDMASNLGKVSIGTGGVIKKLKLLKVAIISTGVGALVLALGSLVTFFTKTQRGADMVSKAMAGISAGVSVLIDRLSSVGESLVMIFSGDFQRGFEQLKNSFVGIGDEIEREAKAASELEERMQALIRAEIDLITARAKARAEVKVFNKVAEDTTKSLEERLNAANEAIRIENE